MHDLGHIAVLSGCNYKMQMVWHQNVGVYPVPLAGAQEADAIYYDVATPVFTKEWLPIFDNCGDEIRETFIGVALEIWHTILPGRVRNPTYRN